MNKIMKIALTKPVTDEKGQAFVLSLILLLVGALIITPLLGLMSTGLIAGQALEEKMEGLYAADAGIEDALYNILTPAATYYGDLQDLNLDESLTLPQIVVNGNDVGVVILLEEDVESFLEGLLGGDAGVHDDWTVIAGVLTPGIYEITVTYTPPPPGHENKKLNGVGAWLQGDYEYVAVPPASGLTDDYPVFNFEVTQYKNGTAFIWEWQGNNRPEFGELTGAYEATLTFRFTPEDIPNLHFSWFVGGSADIGVVVGAQTFGIWKVTATAIDSATGKQTKVIAYVSNQGEGTEEDPSTVDIITWEID